MEDAKSAAEILAEMGSEEYEAARILMSMKCPGNTGVSRQPSPGPSVPWRVPMVMLSLWTAASVLPVSTPYFLWHGKRGYVRMHSDEGGTDFEDFFFLKI